MSIAHPPELSRRPGSMRRHAIYTARCHEALRVASAHTRRHRAHASERVVQPQLTRLQRMIGWYKVIPPGHREHRRGIAVRDYCPQFVADDLPRPLLAPLVTTIDDNNFAFELTKVCITHFQSTDLLLAVQCQRREYIGALATRLFAPRRAMSAETRGPNHQVQDHVASSTFSLTNFPHPVIVHPRLNIRTFADLP